MSAPSMNGYDDISAIWLCGRDQLPSLRAAVESGSERIPVKVLALDSEVVDFLRESPKPCGPISWFPACDSDAFAVALNRAVHSNPTAFTQFQLGRFEYHDAALRLLAEKAANCLPDMMSFDYVFKFQSCYWLRGATLLRRHGESTFVEASDPESHWLSRSYLEANLTTIARLEPTRGFLRLLFDHLLRKCSSRISSRLIAGNVKVELDECRAFATPSVFVAPRFENWLAARNGAQDGQQEATSSLRPVAEIASVAQLTSALSSATRDFAELNLEIALNEEWAKLSTEIEDDPRLGQVLDIMLADLLGVLCFTVLDTDLDEAAIAARRRIFEELEHASLSPFAKRIARVLLRDDAETHKAPTDEHRAQRWEALRLRMEYAKAVHSLKLARIQNQRLSRSNRDLTRRLSVYRRTETKPLTDGEG